MGSRTADQDRLRRLTRTALLSRVVALVVAFVVMIALGSLGRLGQGLVLVPTVFAAVLIGSVLAAELASRPYARGEHQVAALEVRRVRDYLSVPLTVAAGIVLVVLVITAAWTTTVAAADDLGRAGRSFGYRCVSGSGCDSGAFGPFPGSFYTVPVLIGTALVAVLAVVTLRVAVRRPRNGADAGIRLVDEQIRASSVRSVVAAVALAVSGSLTGLAFAGGGGLVSHRAVLSQGLQTAGVLLLVAGVLGLVGLIWAAAVTLVPLLDRPRIADPARFRPVGARSPR